MKKLESALTLKGIAVHSLTKYFWQVFIFDKVNNFEILGID